MALRQTEYTVEKMDDGYYILRNENAGKMVRLVDAPRKSNQDAHHKEHSESRTVQGSSIRSPK